MKISFILFGLFFFLMACNQNKSAFTKVFSGIWKVEGKEQFEFWELNSKDELVGNSYKLVQSKKVISENLRIIKAENKWIYEATVFNQNKGKAVSFIMNMGSSEIISFENKAHDFPNKIQYKIISPDTMEVSVLGKENKGFTYIQVKQK